MTAPDTVYGTVCNAQQYDQFIQSSANDSSPNITCLTHGETIGLAVRILLVCLCPKLIFCTADSRGLAPQLHRGPHHSSQNWCTSDSLSRVLLV
jgi:hypothetical protein